MAKILIIARPPGEAPEAVREAWVGLELPLPPGRGSRRQFFLASGVLSGPRAWWQIFLTAVLGRLTIRSGYAVNARDAVEILGAKDAVAAAWWREHCAYLLDGKRCFVFPANACEARGGEP
ncbi:MAG: hypothetical protein HY049_13390 [Acidobacteria bacterium]|nr:hypothetical protein [Acidobacteriota bacterium]